MPIPKTPQYGDAARIEQLSSGLKREHGTYGAVVQRNDTGRPTGSTGTPAPRQSAQVEIPVEHQELAKDLAVSDWSRQQLAALAQTSPTPWVQMMLAAAEEEYAENAATFYQATPNFEP
jgi:hypothetical protein